MINKKSWLKQCRKKVFQPNNGAEELYEPENHTEKCSEEWEKEYENWEIFSALINIKKAFKP